MSLKTETLIIMTPAITVHPFTVKALLEITHSPRFKSTWWTEASVDICANRNAMFYEALVSNARWAMFLDADNWTDADAIAEVWTELSRRPRYAAIGGVYKIRSSPDRETLIGGQAVRNEELFLKDLAGKDDIFEVKRLNGGAMILDLTWFRNHWSRAPWFQFLTDVDTGRFIGTEDYVFSDGITDRGGHLLMHKHWIVGHAVPNGDPFSLQQELKRSEAK